MGTFSSYPGGGPKATHTSAMSGGRWTGFEEAGRERVRKILKDRFKATVCLFVFELQDTFHELS